MGDRLPGHMMFQYIMWYEETRDPDWMRKMDALSYQLPPGKVWPKE